MAYVKNIWVDQDVERPKTYEVTNNQDGSITLTDSFGLVTELGTPVNAVNMNHIEDGIANCADIDLINLSDNGEKHFLGKKQFTNCILETPNGVLELISGNSIKVKAGVKVLFSKGRNADGSLNNVEYTLPEDFIVSMTNTGTADGYIVMNEILYSGELPAYYWWDRGIFIQEEEPTNLDNLLPSTAIAWFKPSENVWRILAQYSTQPYTWDIQSSIVLLGYVYRNGTTTVQNVVNYQPVNLLKQNDRFEITRWAMPSNTYIDLTLGASGASYTAPVDGYVKIGKTATAASQYLSLAQAGYTRTMFSTNANAQLWDTMPVAKGTTFNVNYSVAGTTLMFRFYYAQGSESEA